MGDEPVVRRIKADILGDKDSSQALPHYQEALDLNENKRYSRPRHYVEYESASFTLQKIGARMGMLGTRDFIPSLEQWVGTSKKNYMICLCRR